LWLVSTSFAVFATPAFAQNTAPPASAPAPSSAPGDPGQDQGENGPDIVIVSTFGRAQELQKVPAAVSAVSAISLQNTGAVDIRQLNQLAPSLLVSSTGNEANGAARIRGVGTVGDNPGLESSVPVFIDGVYRSRTGSGLNELGEIERIEVQRGPQGTLGGRNSTAGMISIISKRPDFNAFGGTVEATYGNYNYWRLGGSLNAPLGKTLAARIDGVWLKRDGFYKDVVNNVRVNNRDRYFVRGQLMFEPSSDVSFRLIGDYTHRSEACCAATYVRNADNPYVDGLLDPSKNTILKVLTALGQNPAAFTANPYDRNIYVSPGRSYAGKTKDWGVSGELNWTLGGAKLTSITAYRDYQSNQGSDTDYGEVDILYRTPGKTAYDRRFRTFSQELRVQGEAFGGTLDWLVGGYYANEKLDLADNLKFGSQYGRFATCRIVTGGGLAALYSPTSPGCLAARPAAFGADSAAIYAAFDRLDLVNNVGSVDDVYRQTSNNFAVFTHNIIHVTKTIDLTLGGRWTTETKKFNATFNNNNVYCLPQQAAMDAILVSATSSASAKSAAGALATLACLGNSSSELNGASVNDKRHENQFTGTAILSWRPISQLMLYASYARGYKAGGFNLDRSSIGSAVFPLGGAAGAQAKINAGVLQFRPEKVNSFEAGAKLTLRDFTFNVSAFREQFTNFQLNTFNGSVYVVQNISGCSNLIGGSGADEDTSAATGSCAKGDVTYGVRSQGVELEASVSPSRYLRFNAGFTYADTKYRSDLVGNDQGSPLDPALRVLPGKQMSNAPKYVTTASIAWTPPIGGSGLSALFYVDTRMTGDYNTGSDLFPQKGQDGFALVNGRIGIRGPDSHWSIEVWGQNLFNQGYAQVAFNSPFQAGSTTPNFTSAQFPGGAQIFSAFLAEPRTYGITLRGKF
jgi:outer membrane receptor protein involved in Fe transport